MKDTNKRLVYVARQIENFKDTPRPMITPADRRLTLDFFQRTERRWTSLNRSSANATPPLPRTNDKSASYPMKNFVKLISARAAGFKHF